MDVYNVANFLIIMSHMTYKWSLLLTYNYGNDNKKVHNYEAFFIDKHKIVPI